MLAAGIGGGGDGGWLVRRWWAANGGGGGGDDDGGDGGDGEGAGAAVDSGPLANPYCQGWWMVVTFFNRGLRMISRGRKLGPSGISGLSLRGISVSLSTSTEMTSGGVWTAAIEAAPWRGEQPR